MQDAAVRSQGIVRRLLAARKLLSFRMYLGIAGAATMTLAASLVGLFSFNQLGGAVTLVNEESVPDMSAAFEVGLTSGALASVGGQLITTTSSAQFQRVVEDVDEERDKLQEQLDDLEQRTVDPQLFGRVRRDVDTLILNIDSLKSSMEGVFNLQTRLSGVQRELELLNTRVDELVIPVIDDQIFYVITGYTDVSSPPPRFDEHLSIAEVGTYQRLAQLQGNATLASQTLASAFSLSSAEGVGPLRDRFLAVQSSVRGDLAALEGHPLHRDFDNLLTDLFFLGVGDDRSGGEGRVFDLVEQQLRLTENQLDLLNTNRSITVRLLQNVDVMADGSQVRVQETAAATTQAITFGRTVLLAISAVSVVGAVALGWLVIGPLLRRLEMLSAWMRQMAAGDLEAQADIGGQDEVADMAAALEVFRRHALEVQRLNLVEQMAEELQGKNDELEKVLGDLQTAQEQIVMQEKLAALGELTAGVAHEIRNPLNFVKNFSEASTELITELREIASEDKPEVTQDDRSYILEVADDLKENLERVLSHTARADRIVADMLRMGRSSDARQMTDVNQLIEEYAKLAYHSARAADSEVQLHFEFDLDDSVGDMEMLSQDMGRVFLNMVSNACYASNEKRQQLIGAGAGAMDFIPTVWISTKRDEDAVVIRLRDNGTGMPPEVQEKMFNPFFTTKPTDKGTGLGLAISADIVRSHGGHIEVESEPGDFTEMTITLPLTDPSSYAEAESAPAAEPAAEDDDELDAEAESAAEDDGEETTT